jgi:PAS domain S-box-containing protein
MANDLEKVLKELRLTMGKMEMALGLIDEAIVWINHSGTVEWCNGVFDRLTDRSHIELINQPLIDLIVLKEVGTPLSKANHPVMKVLERNTVQRGVYQLGPEQLPVELVAVPLTLPNQPGGAILTLRDISEIHELEQVRLQSLALQAAADAIVITDANGCIMWVNPAFTALSGYSADDVYGQRPSILQSGQNPNGTYRKMWKVISSGQVWHGELVNRRLNGTIYFEEQSITPVIDRAGTITHYIAIKRDISQRKEAEAEIRKLSSVATRTDNAVIIANAKGEIEWVNEAFTRMTEYTLKEVVNLRPGDFLQGDETLPETVREMSESLAIQDGFNVEIVNYSKSGRKYWVSIEMRPLLDESDRITNYLAIENDITERKQSEEKLAAARNREIDIAARIQRTLLLGRSREQINGVQMAALSVPSQKVDGDFYDCFVHNEDCMDVVLGDVMGKGVPAALLGGATKSAILRSMNRMMSSSADHHLPFPCEIIMSLHAAIANELIALNSFVTLFYGRVSSKQGVLQFVDCGHTRSIHCGETDESCRFFSGANMPLGFSAREAYKETEIPLSPGDVVVLYSDGITEATDAEGAMFGEDRLLEVVRQNRYLKCAAILEKIQQAVGSFSTSQSFGDDLTCLVIKVDLQQPGAVKGSASYSYPAAHPSLSSLRKNLADFFAAHFVQPGYQKDFDQLQAGVNEAATNIIEHAFPQPGEQDEVEMILTARQREITIELCHNGAAFSGGASILPAPEGHTESGFGLYIMEQSLDSIHYTRRADGWNRLVLKKTLHETEQANDES